MRFFILLGLIGFSALNALSEGHSKNNNLSSTPSQESSLSAQFKLITDVLEIPSQLVYGSSTSQGRVPVNKHRKPGSTFIALFSHPIIQSATPCGLWFNPHVPFLIRQQQLLFPKHYFW